MGLASEEFLKIVDRLSGFSFVISLNFIDPIGLYPNDPAWRNSLLWINNPIFLFDVIPARLFSSSSEKKKAHGEK